METPEIIASLTTRVETLEAALQAVMQKLSDKKPRTTGPLDDAEKEARRLRVNEQSRLSKLKQRCRQAGYGDDLAAYQAYMAAKRNKTVELLVKAADGTPAEAVPAGRTVVEFDDILTDTPTEAEASQERNEEADQLPSEAGNQPDVVDDRTPDEQAPATKNRKKK